MTIKEIIKRYILLILGLFIMAFGITLMVDAKIGTSPISSVPYVFSLEFISISLGTFTFMWNMLMIFGQAIILKKDFKVYELIQIPISILFGVFVDFSKYLLRDINPQNYAMSIFILALGCITLSLGVTLTVIASVVMNSGEALVKAICIKTKKEFGNIKVVFDVTLVLMACLASLIFFGEVRGVREGTFIAAVVTGFIVKAFTQILKPLIDKWLIEEEVVENSEMQ